MSINNYRISKKWNNIVKNSFEYIEDLEPMPFVMFNLPIIWAISFASFTNTSDNTQINTVENKKTENIKCQSVKKDDDLMECNIFTYNKL